MREAACVAAAWAASGAMPSWAQSQATMRRYDRALLVDPLGEPIRAGRLKAGEPYLFNYPYAASPVFLIVLDAGVPGHALRTEAGQAYATPSGVGPSRSIVAFSAICAHKLVYPTSQLSFISVRRGGAGEPAQVIHCCSDESRYDPAQGARVIAGPAPQPLAAVVLEWQAKGDELYALGTIGGELFDAFFEKYAFRLQTEWGSRARALVGTQTAVRPASAYSRQWQTCRVPRS